MTVKAVARLGSEPVALGAYRAEHPEDDAAPGDEAGAVWTRFKDDPAYKAVLLALTEAQQGLCMYCEQRLVDRDGARVFGDYQIEHVRPKSGGAGRTLDWTNVALACGGGTYPHHSDGSRRGTGRHNESCGQRKGSAELVRGCDPRAFVGVARLVNVDLLGVLTADPVACQAAGVSGDALEASITMLNLNCERLRMTRQSVMDEVRSWQLAIMLEGILPDSHLSPDQRRELLDLVIASRLQPDEHRMLRAFWTAERCALSPGADAWCSQNAHLF